MAKSIRSVVLISAFVIVACCALVVSSHLLSGDTAFPVGPDAAYASNLRCSCFLPISSSHNLLSFPPGGCHSTVSSRETKVQLRSSPLGTFLYLGASFLEYLSPSDVHFSHIQAWLSSWATMSDMPKAERLALLIEEDEWKNSLVMWMFPDYIRDQLPRYVQAWIRNWIMCLGVYFGFGGAWCYYTYFCFGDVLFKPGTIPAMRDVVEQIWVAAKSVNGVGVPLASIGLGHWRQQQCRPALAVQPLRQLVSVLAIPLYSLLPAFSEYCAEEGWTMVYPRVENVGLPMYVIYFYLYMCSVEFGVYWVHRGLHDWKTGYKSLHYIHHKYNKEHTLSPFAGLAFHPIDGMLQAAPYVWSLFFIPTHFLTHELLLFATGIWTTNIHDCIHGKTWPVLGAGYHAIHHTTYKHNYGHYFVFMDQMFNSLETPEEHEAKDQARQQATTSQ
eukprot:gene14177-20144_t